MLQHMTGDFTFKRRIGVFICRCGKNIAQSVDVPRLADLCATLPWVACVDENIYTCSDDGLSSIIEKVKTEDLTRVVVASCTPRTHEPLFRETVEKAGLNKYLFEFVNIREQCSWIHPQDIERATAKAFDLIAMGAAKAAALKPLHDVVTPVEPAALVIGGGVAGMKAALALSSMGAVVHIVEKEPALGGLLRSLSVLHPEMVDGAELIRSLEEKLRHDPRITVHTSGRIKSVKGYVGNYDAEILKRGNGGEAVTGVKAGVVVVATGAAPFEPRGLYLWEEDERVITSLQLEEEFKRGVVRKGSIVIINCAALPRLGSGYCGRICCSVGIKQALELARGSNGAAITIVGRNQMVWGERGESSYREALKQGIRFIRIADETPPAVQAGRDGGLRVRAVNMLTGETETLAVDCVVLNVPLVPRPGSRDIARELKVPLEYGGFFKEKHPKLSPVEFSSSGIFICGAARFPSTTTESISQANAAALKAASMVRAGTITMDAATAAVRDRVCSGCGWCQEVCPYGAITLSEDRRGRMVAAVNESLCKGCGSCAAACPSGVMDQNVFGDKQIMAMIRSLSQNAAADGKEPVILTFACNWCSYAGADLAGVSRLRIPPNIRIVRVMCSGRVRPEWILSALRSGLDGVLVLGCHPGECHYEEGNYRARRRVDTLKELLRLSGFDHRRVRIDWVSASEGARFKKIIEEMVETVSGLM